MAVRHVDYALILVLVLPVVLLALDVDNPPVGVFSDEWYVIRIKGSKSGHAHATMERVDSRSLNPETRPAGSRPHTGLGTGSKQAGGDVVRTKLEIALEMGRAGQTVGLQMTQESEESLQGQPLAFRHCLKMGAMPGPTTEGKIRNGKVAVTTVQFGQRGETKTYDLPKGAMLSWAVYREQLKRGLEPGTKYDLPIYEPSLALDRLTSATVEILERDTLDLYGRRVEAVKTKQTLRVKGMLGVDTPVESVTWLTDDGSPVRVEMTIINWPIEMLACTKSVALAPNDPAELMLDTLIWPDGPIKREADKIRYRLTLKDRTGKADILALPETDIQKTGRRAEDEVRLTVQRRAAVLKGTGPNKLMPQERERYLAASSVVNHKDAVVAKLAKEAAGGEKDPWKLAERLCEFVGRFVEDKNLSVGFATASEVARSKAGDCTEHGVLLAALGRACGIPTRIVTGVVYAGEFGGKQGVFVGHLWTQFWIDGWWVDLDAARGEVVVAPTHIALSLSDADDDSIADMVNSVWLNLGKLKITVLPDE